MGRGRYRDVLLAVVVTGIVIAGSGAGAVTSAHFSDSEAANGTLQAATDFPYFEVSIDGTNSPVREGDLIYVNATITNNGSVSATQTIQLNVSGQTNPIDTQELDIDPYTSESVTLTWQTAGDDGGQGNQEVDYTATVISDDESNSTPVQVQGVPGNGNGNGRGNGNGSGGGNGNGGANGQQ